MGLSSQFVLSILNTGDDDFGSYASDGLNDAWQVGHFGLDNPMAGPAKDPDGDEQDNQFEFLAKLDPKNPDSFFNVYLQSVLNQPNQMEIILDPVFNDRTYSIFTKTELTQPNWIAFSGPEITVGNQRTVTDSNAGTRKFYQIRILE